MKKWQAAKSLGLGHASTSQGERMEELPRWIAMPLVDAKSATGRQYEHTTTRQGVIEIRQTALTRKISGTKQQVPIYDHYQRPCLPR